MTTYHALNIGVNIILLRTANSDRGKVVRVVFLEEGVPEPGFRGL